MNDLGIKTFEQMDPLEQRVLTKAVLATPEGRAFFGHLLFMLNFTRQHLRPPTTDEVLTDLLRLTGYFDPENYNNVLKQLAGLDNTSYPTRMIVKVPEETAGGEGSSAGRGEQP